MKRLILSAVVILVVSPAEVLAQRGRKKETKHSGRYCKVTLDFDSKPYAKSVADLADAAWSAAFDTFGERPRRNRKFDLYVFRDRQGFVRIVGRGLPQVHESQRTHVASGSRLVAIDIETKLTTAGLTRIGPAGETNYRIVDTVIRLARRELIRHNHALPFWLDRGLRHWLRAETLVTPNKCVTRSAHCRFASAQQWAQRSIRKGEFPQVALLLQKERVGAHGSGMMYAADMLFCCLMEEHRDVFVPFLRGTCKMTRRALDAKRLGQELRKKLGPKLNLDQKLARYIGRCHPKWGTSMGLSMDGDCIFAVGRPEFMSTVWRAKPVGTTSFELLGAFEICEATKPRHSEVMFLLGKQRASGYPETMVTICIAGDGSVTLHDRSIAEEREVLAEGKVPAVTVHKRYPVRVRVKDDVLEVHVAGKRAVIYDVTGFGLDGSWGLGAPKGCAGIFEKVRSEAR